MEEKKVCPHCDSEKFVPNPEAGGGVPLYICLKCCKEFDTPKLIKLAEGVK